MRIALTGTPGTGKSSVARRLRVLGEEVIGLNELARRHGFLGRYDRKRRTREVDLGRLGRLVELEHPAASRLFLEGHYSHLLGVDRAVVLRCSPPVLRRRLARRGYPESKVRENSLAEALDSITAEAAMRLGRLRVVELDTTRLEAKEAASLIQRLARGGFRGAGRYLPGRIDWSEDIFRNSDYYSRI